MSNLLGLDIGSNSVGSAWIDTQEREIRLAVSVFPAGVDEQENKRGAPKNQDRRQKRSQRRNLARRAGRKRALRSILTDSGLLPSEPPELCKLFDTNPWLLRRAGLERELSAYEFGRVLVHLAQRRGALGITTDPEDPDEGKVKEGIDRLDALMKERNARTVGQLMADLMDERQIDLAGDGKCCQSPIRNRQYRMSEDDQLYADRRRIREEFNILWEKQKSFGGELPALLTDDLKRRLDDPRKDDTWRHRGVLFGQRNTFWKTGTLGRCVLEPTDRCAPQADLHASYFKVVEYVNNLRIRRPGEDWGSLDSNQRNGVIQKLRGPLTKKSKGQTVPKKSASFEDVRAALGLPRASKKRTDPFEIKQESDDPDRPPNTDWFHREIVHGAFGEERWNQMSEQERKSVNRAILKFDPDHEDDAKRLRDGTHRWWSLDPAAADRLVDAWKGRPKLEKRLNLSRWAILNLLPYMECFDAQNNRWPTQQEARKAHAKVLQQQFEQTGDCAYELAARRYATGALGLTAADRYYMRQEKHQLKDEHGQLIRDENGESLRELPPAPTLSNPVVRKAIHEVRRHLLAWMRKFRRKPDRVVIEFARGVQDTAKRRNEQLKANRERDQERKQIEQDLQAWGIPQSNWARATLRVRLWREQSGVCPFSLSGPNANRTISPRMAAEGRDVEVEHIIPQGLTARTMAFNNLVLCYREANRGKGMHTPLDWLGPEGVKAMLQRLENAPIKANRIKWERLQSPTPDEEGFRNSQLTDTAYAARQVAAYIADALYDGQGLPERGGERKIFTTKGEYTSRLRADWGLHESTIDRAHALEIPPTAEELARDPHLEQSSRRARKEGKDRSDHRHHAIDALVTALLGPELLTVVGRHAREDREYYERTRYRPRRKALPHPRAWQTPEPFRDDVVAAFEKLVVANRPVKRRLAGAFHDEDLYGSVLAPLPSHRKDNPKTVFSLRMPIFKNRDKRLKPGHVRVPPGWDALTARLDETDLTAGERKQLRRQLAGLADPPAGKGGIVRDRTVRDRIRKCLRAAGIDPDGFSQADIQSIARQGALTMASGAPIKSVVLLRTNTDPIIIPRKQWDPATGKMVSHMDPADPLQPHPRTKRVYIGGNNHHVEIREHRRTGKWSGEVVSAFEAAKQNAARLDALCKAGVPRGLAWRKLSKAEREQYKPKVAKVNAQFPVVNRNDDGNSRFILSLCEGEMIYARRKDRPDEPPSYFVVCKLDKPATGQPRIHFAPHWDARKAPPPDKKKRTREHQDRWDITPGHLKECGPDSYPFDVPEGFSGPAKIRVSALGEVTLLERD